jgi:hypothetical protein
LEKLRVVDQRRQRVLAFIAANAETLAKQGAVVTSFRWRGGRRVGPYYHLALRQGRRQRSVYLGADAELVAEVRIALREIQADQRERRAIRRQKKAIRKALVQCRAKLRRELARRGLRLKGYEVRGWHTPGRQAAVASEDG